MEIETIKSNKLKAEFMGYEVGYDDNFALTEGTFKFMKYRTSWDWLIPVVQKINSIEYLRSDMEIRFSSSPMCVLRTRTDNNHWDVLVCKDSEGLETIYATVLEFIKWYNINK